VQEDGPHYLVETAIAPSSKQLKERYGMVEDHHVLLDSLAERSALTHEDIDVVSA